MNIEKFKQCPSCKRWLSSNEVLHEPQIKPFGMAYLEDEAGTAYYYFQHAVSGCGSSFLINIKEFEPFIEEELPQVSLRGSGYCGGHCVDLHELSICNNECFYAPFRRFILRLLETKKAAEASK